MAVKILIDGEKLGALLEAKTHKSLKELSLENGFSKNFLSEAVRCNRATAPVISVAKIYGIELESYKAVEKIEEEVSQPPREGGQISLDDLSQMQREELKSIIKEAIIETFNNFSCNEIRGTYDQISRVYTMDFFIRHKEA